MSNDYWMQRCFDLAQHGAGNVSPNPLVGCVIVQDDEAIGKGFHTVYGGPHAEVEAIRNVEDRGFGNRLTDATLYVNLEPCSHHGKTPPCADLIVKKGIPRVVIAIQDPNPKVAGQGIRRLKDAGVDVAVGVLEKQAKRLNEAFCKHVVSGRPLVTLKIARSKDGKVAGREGATTIISSLESRTLVHRWRSEMDAVVIGSGTAMVDDPQLTVRHIEGRQPFRVVLDRPGTLPPSLRLFTDQHVAKTIAIVSDQTTPLYENDLVVKGGRVIRVSEINGHLDLSAILYTLGRGEGLEQPIQSVLVEAGPNLSTALLEQDMVDRLFMFTSPNRIGEGIPAFHSWFPEEQSFAAVEKEQVGGDELFKGFFRAV